MNKRVVAMPVSRDVLFPFRKRGAVLSWTEDSLFLLRIVEGKEPCIIGKMDTWGGKFYGLSTEIKKGAAWLSAKLKKPSRSTILDILAEQFMSKYPQQRSDYNLKMGKIIVTPLDGKEVHVVSVDFYRKSIHVKRGKNQWIYAMPKSFLDRNAVIEGLGIRWWSIAKAIGALYYQDETRLSYLTKDINGELEKFVIATINLPPVEKVKIISGKRGSDSMFLSDTPEKDYDASLIVVAIDDIYYRVDFAHNLISIKGVCYYSPKHNTGIWEDDSIPNQEPMIFPIDIRRSGDEYKLILGNGTWLSFIDSVPRNLYNNNVYFLLSVGPREDQSSRSEGLTPFYLGPEDSSRVMEEFIV